MGSNGDSKLCADKPRHAEPQDLWSAATAQLGKGEPFRSPVASLSPVPPPASTETAPVSAPSGSRSGSERRQRSKGAILVRLLPEERAAIELKARSAGMSLASFARAVMLGHPGPRARRSPTVNAELLAFAIAALNRAGNNLNQIAHALNSARSIVVEDCLATLAEVRAAAARIRDSVGRERSDAEGNPRGVAGSSGGSRGLQRPEGPT
jgi:hypothetical protein